MAKRENDYFSKTIEKGLSIINLFDQNHTRRNLTEISRALGINTTSTYRFVNTLVELGYLKKVSNSHILKLGPKALTTGYQFLQGFELLQTVKPIIDQTYKEKGFTIDSVLKNRDKLIALYRRESKSTINFRHPLVSTSLYARATGKAVLAYISAEELSQFIKKTEFQSKTKNTIVEKDVLLGELELIKKRGYSLSNEEYLSGLNAIGAPLINIRNNQVIGAISFDFLALKHSIKSIESKYADSIKKMAMDLSNMITVADD